ncbi:MAG TPA: zinc-finger domain-containing protein [Aquabacterium sp.]|nr:zinc-finger domain-containing protein [Aquabacterium sp.]HRH30288.1 zinc-finger domain-containing protein [Aquabacterium sp.]
MSTNTQTPKAVVEVTAAEVQGPGVVFCPNPKQALWSNHPRVYIDLAKSGEGRCPYCGTVYKLKEGEHLHGH